ncbi:hypothetical protein KAT82_06150 [bacterium]|nr:hypothetical protein [bacterium]
MMRIILAVALVIALAMSAGAYDVLYSNDTAATHYAGDFGIDVSFLYFMGNSGYDANGESVDFPADTDYTGMWFPINIYYGVMDGFELGVAPIFKMDKLTDPDPDGELSATGIGDTWIWAKYAFMPDPMLTARVGFKLATGEDDPDAEELPLGTGQMDIDGALLFGVPVGPGSFDAALGYRYRLAQTIADVDYKPGSEFHFFAGYTHFLGDAMNLRLGADGYFGSDAEEDIDDGNGFQTVDESASNTVYINPGFDYVMANGVVLGFDMHYPLMGANIVADWGLGLSVGWGN